MEPETTPTTKEALLLAAGELFAENGVEGTSIRAIAERCQANIAAVNYHFGSKENLYMALVRYVLERSNVTGRKICFNINRNGPMIRPNAPRRYIKLWKSGASNI